MGLSERTEQAGENFALTGEAIEKAAETIENYLQAVHTERTDMLRIRFSLEEALLRWRDRFGEDARVRLTAGKRLGRPTITMELTGDPYDPLTNAENDLGAWADSLLSGIGLSPVYTYRRNTNTVQLRLKRRQFHPVLALGIAVALGLLVGLLGEVLLPDTLRELVLRVFFEPVRTAFLRILNTAAGPIIFFSVLSAVCGVGSAALMSKAGRKLILRFLASISVMTVVAAAAALLLFRPEVGSGAESGEIHGMLDLFFRIIPTDIFTPMISGNSPQLILIAVILGHAFLSVGQQTGGLIAIVEQINAVGLLIADWVGQVAPYFISLLLIFGIWSESAAPFAGIWKPVVLFCAVLGILFILQITAVAAKEKLSPLALFDKLRSSFAVAFRTCSVNSAYGANQTCCERRLGIDRQLVKIGLPLGLLIYMPAGTVAAMIVVLCEAAVCHITVSPFWLIAAVLLTVTLQAASPPVTGIGLLTYAVVFAQLGIPEDALMTAMLLDILFGFVTAPFNQAMLQLELIPEADRAGLLNKKILRG